MKQFLTVKGDNKRIKSDAFITRLLWQMCKREVVLEETLATSVNKQALLLKVTKCHAPCL